SSSAAARLIRRSTPGPPGFRPSAATSTPALYIARCGKSRAAIHGMPGPSPLMPAGGEADNWDARGGRLAATLTIHDEAATGETLLDLTLHVSAERITVRDLIRHRVRHEVEEYNHRKPDTFRGLVQPTDSERTLNATDSNSPEPSMPTPSSRRRSTRS